MATCQRMRFGGRRRATAALCICSPAFATVLQKDDELYADLALAVSGDEFSVEMTLQVSNA